ncbi:MAG: PilZ domain-containing protein [Nitrospirae bacterium]|nr:MAG: PilZ domain-containing protein [Nitrospirota bacterium]
MENTGLPGSNGNGQEKNRILSSALKLRKIVNRLNYLNFSGMPLSVVLRSSTGATLSLKAHPEPCCGTSVQCRWDPRPQASLAAFSFSHILVNDGHEFLAVRPRCAEMDTASATFDLSELEISEGSLRMPARSKASGIEAVVTQHGIMLEGVLNDFSAMSFGVAVPETFSHLLNFINREDTFHLSLRNSGREIVYTGECTLAGMRAEQDLTLLVFAPRLTALSRFRRKEMRSERHRLHPTPHISLRHPLSGEELSFRVLDISGAGVSLPDTADRSTLVVGMLINEVSIEFTRGIAARCRAQVVYRETEQSEAGRPDGRIGIAFLDMPAESQAFLADVLARAKDSRSHVCAPVDTNELWRFFFESGFVYPEKYHHLLKSRERFQEVYDRLYRGVSSIGRHFTHHDRDEINGHISMLHVHDRTWLLHHHAAGGRAESRAGIAVLCQAASYINDCHNLPSSHIRYILSYFRPENRFPARVFGGFEQRLGDRKRCSRDTGAYFLFRSRTCNHTVRGLVEITAPGRHDIEAVTGSYAETSGGLLLQSLGIQDAGRDQGIGELYRAAGFSRVVRRFAVRTAGRLSAYAVVSVSDTGLNLSGLTSCIQFFVVDPEGLGREEFFSAVSELSRYYEEEEVPVMVYPASYAQAKELPVEKLYEAWVLDVHEGGDSFMRYLEELLTRGKARYERRIHK